MQVARILWYRPVVTDDVVSGLEGGAWEAVRGGEPGGDVQDEDLDGQQD